MNPALKKLDHAAAVEFLLNRVDFERAASIPYHALGFKLDRMRELLARLGNPQERLKIVHVAGTKGKGSTSAMISAMLTAAGIRTGLFSSPHLEKVEERFAVDGVDCAETELVGLVEQLQPVVAEMDQDASRSTPLDSGPTYFELTTAMALLHFVNHGATAAVLEVGMGGRLDSTNVCTPVVAVITSISFDHTKQLGNTLAEIAAEKGGIIKPGVPTISGVLDAEPRDVIATIGCERNSRLIQAESDFTFDYHSPHNLQNTDQRATIDYRDLKSAGGVFNLNNVSLPLIGKHQGANAAVAIATIHELQRQGWQIGEQAIRDGLTSLRWPARVEIISRRPTVLLDVAHNVASVAALLEVLQESIVASRRILIFATTKDKDVPGMLRLLLPHFDRVFLTRYTKNPRGVPVDELHQIAEELGYSAFVESCADVAAAWRLARQAAKPDGLICVTGSFFLAAEIREELASE